MRDEIFSRYYMRVWSPGHTFCARTHNLALLKRTSRWAGKTLLLARKLLQATAVVAETGTYFEAILN